MVAWKWNQVNFIWDEEAADSGGLFPVEQYTWKFSAVHAEAYMPCLRHLGQYEYRNHRMPPSVAILAIILLVIFCIGKMGRR